MAIGSIGRVSDRIISVSGHFGSGLMSGMMTRRVRSGRIGLTRILIISDPSGFRVDIGRVESGFGLIEFRSVRVSVESDFGLIGFRSNRYNWKY